MDRPALEQALLRHPFFDGIKEAHILDLAGCGSEAHFDAGEIIFRQQEQADYFYVIQQGKVALDIHVGEEEPLTIQTIGPGRILGWSWLFSPYRWQFEARAVEPTSVIAMDARCIRGKIEVDAHLGYDLLQRFSKILIDRLQATRMQLIDMYASKRSEL